MRRDHDLRDAVLRIGHVELRAVLVVEVGHVLVSHGDLGDHFVIDHLLNGELLADVIAQVVHGVVARLELALELFLGVGALELGELVLDFAVGGLQPQRLGFFEQNVIVDQLIEDVQLERQRLVLRRLGGIRIQLRVVVLVHFGAGDVAAVHDGPHVLVHHLRLLAAGAERRQDRGQ